MDCYRTRRLLAAYCDAGLSPGEREDIQSHLARCRSCEAVSRQYVRGRAALRALPVLTPPAHLLTSLRVLASHERARRLAGERLPDFMAQWFLRARLWARLMMQPLALPVAGGLVSAVILFALVIPNLLARHAIFTADVPTTLSTEAAFVGLGPYGIGGEEVTVDMTLDSQGRFLDYSIPGGQTWVQNPGSRRSVENALLFLRFAPGTTFGQPASSKIRLTLRRSHIDVRG